MAARHAAAMAEIASNQALASGATAAAAAEQERTQRQSAQAAALALHALARRGDGDFSLRTLLSAAQRGWTATVDQAMRQIMASQQCVQLNRPVYDPVWPAGGAPNVLIAAIAGLPAPTAPSLLIRQIEQVAARAAWLSLDGNNMLVPSGEDTAQIVEVATGRVRA